MIRLSLHQQQFRAIAAAYFSLQAISIIAWWVLLITVPESVNLFHPKDWLADSMFAFAFPDMVILVVGSLMAVFAIVRRSSQAKLIVWCITVAAAYPTLYCLSVSVMTSTSWLATASMSCMTAASMAFASSFCNSTDSPSAIREVKWSPIRSIQWTLFQTVIFWTLFLWIIPMGILEIQCLVGFAEFDHWYRNLAATLLFIAASVLGLTSGMTMASLGNGTPLPTATASKLVESGPYQFVRNPMAVAGIAQGIAVGWYFGSVAIIVYSLTGAVLWHVMVRPMEEDDLESRFGASYVDYRRRVSLWVPQFWRENTD